MPGVTVEAIEGGLRRFGDGPNEFTAMEGRFFGFGRLM